VRDRIIARRLAVELARHGVRARLEPTGLAIRHTITFRRIEVELWRGTVEGRDSSRVPRSVGPRRASSRGGAIRNDRSRRDGAERPRLRFVDPLAPRVAITGLARKIGRLLADSVGKRGKHGSGEGSPHSP
jgi:hypothetical protein